MAIDTRGFSLSTLPVYNPIDPRLFAVEYPDFANIAQQGISSYFGAKDAIGRQEERALSNELNQMQIESAGMNLAQQRKRLQDEEIALQNFNAKVGILENMEEQDIAGLQTQDQEFYQVLKETKNLGLAPTPENYQAVALAKAEREAKQKLEEIKANAAIQVEKLKKGEPYTGPLYDNPVEAARFFPEYEIEYNATLGGYIPTRKREADTRSEDWLIQQGARLGYTPEAWMALTNAERNTLVNASRSLSGSNNEAVQQIYNSMGYGDLIPQATSPIAPAQPTFTSPAPSALPAPDRTQQAADRVRNALLQ